MRSFFAVLAIPVATAIAPVVSALLFGLRGPLVAMFRRQKRTGVRMASGRRPSMLSILRPRSDAMVAATSTLAI